jgi:hypothetical protein
MYTRKANWQLWDSKGLRKLVILALVAVLAGQTRGQTENSAVFKNPSNESIMMYDFDLHELSVLEDPPVGHTLKERPPDPDPELLRPAFPLLCDRSCLSSPSLSAPPSNPHHHALPTLCHFPAPTFFLRATQSHSSQSKHISADCCLLLS